MEEADGAGGSLGRDPPPPSAAAAGVPSPMTVLRVERTGPPLLSATPAVSPDGGGGTLPSHGTITRPPPPPPPPPPDDCDTTWSTLANTAALSAAEEQTRDDRDGRTGWHTTHQILTTDRSQHS